MKIDLDEDTISKQGVRYNLQK